MGSEHGKIVLSPTKSTENTTLPVILLVPPDGHQYTLQKYKKYIHPRAKGRG